MVVVVVAVTVVDVAVVVIFLHEYLLVVPSHVPIRSYPAEHRKFVQALQVNPLEVPEQAPAR